MTYTPDKLTSFVRYLRETESRVLCFDLINLNHFQLKMMEYGVEFIDKDLFRTLRKIIGPNDKLEFCKFGLIGLCYDLRCSSCSNLNSIRNPYPKDQGIICVIKNIDLYQQIYLPPNPPETITCTWIDVPFNQNLDLDLDLDLDLYPNLSQSNPTPESYLSRKFTFHLHDVIKCRKGLNCNNKRCVFSHNHILCPFYSTGCINGNKCKFNHNPNDQSLRKRRTKKTLVPRSYPY